MYSQILRSYKDDIAERLSYFRDLADRVLSDDPDDENLRRSFHDRTNTVKALRQIVDHCLENEERAKRFMKAFRKHDPYLYDDLRQYGPRGKFVRKAPPAVTLTEKVCATLGDRAHALKSILLMPECTRRLTCIMSVLDILLKHGQLLPEEYAELWLDRNNEYAMVRCLENLCRDTTIPEPNRHFISLVMSSFNMHVFGLPKMSMKDVLCFHDTDV